MIYNEALRKELKIYVASSWRNDYQPEVVNELRKAGHEVYDFRNPPNGSKGFAWSDIDEDWLDWTTEDYAAALDHPVAIEGFNSDFDGMKWADCCVMVLPCGRSANTEAGWMKGSGKPVYILSTIKQEPELMYKLYDGIFSNTADLISHITTRLAALDDGDGYVENHTVSNAIGAFDESLSVAQAAFPETDFTKKDSVDDGQKGKGLDLVKLQEKFDKFFAEETEESFNEWLKMKGYLKSPFYCQSDIEDRGICSNQCDHCRTYYKPLEQAALPLADGEGEKVGTVEILEIIKEKVCGKGFNTDANKQADLYLFLVDKLVQLRDGKP